MSKSTAGGAGGSAGRAVAQPQMPYKSAAEREREAIASVKPYRDKAANALRKAKLPAATIQVGSMVAISRVTSPGWQVKSYAFPEPNVLVSVRDRTSASEPTKGYLEMLPKVDAIIASLGVPYTKDGNDRWKLTPKLK